MLSYAILVYNEVKEITKLLDVISKTKTNEDEIVILQDSSAPSEIITEIKNICDKYSVDVYTKRPFVGNFAKQKNTLTSLCTKEWVVNLDADEMISDVFIRDIKSVILDNPDIDSIKLPRVNIIEGSSSEFMEVQKNMPGYGWIVNEHNHINFPDFQERVYRNNNIIEWSGEVHEVVVGAKNRSAIPPDYTYQDLFIRHPKTMNRQFIQNYNYLNIMEDSRFTQEGYDGLLYVNYNDDSIDFELDNLQDTVVITTKNKDYELEELKIFIAKNNHKKRILWITNNLTLFLYLKTISKINNNLDVYFLELAETPKESEFFYNFKKIKDNIFRLIYTINIRNSTSIIRNLFNLETKFRII